jgi:50S ribosomal subunit-associated GTPase HflX
VDQIKDRISGLKDKVDVLEKSDKENRKKKKKQHTEEIGMEHARSLGHY